MGVTRMGKDAPLPDQPQLLVCHGPTSRRREEMQPGRWEESKPSPNAMPAVS